MIRMRELFFFFCLLLSFSAQAGPNWEVITGKPPGRDTVNCLIISVPHEIDDGQTRTPVSLIYDGRRFYARTDSTIDLSYTDTGLKIDEYTRHQIDRLYRDTTAVFERNHKLIHQQFIEGVTVKLVLGFWPTWPKTHSRKIDFSLIGYTNAYRQFQKCVKTGKLH